MSSNQSDDQNASHDGPQELYDPYAVARDAPRVENPSVDCSEYFRTDQSWSDRESMVLWARAIARELGTSLSTYKSWKANANRKFGMIHLACEEYGNKRSRPRRLVDENDRVIESREAKSKKNNCPFILHGFEHERDVWRLVVHCGIHNHELSEHLEGHAYEGRLTREEMLDVEEMTAGGSKPKPIIEMIRRKFVGNLTSRQQVYNARAKIQKVKQGDLNPMQLLYKMLVVGEYSFGWRLSNEGRLQDVVFAPRESLMIWQKFPYVMLMDTTYKTNMYEMPLLEIVGHTCTNKTFHIGFAFMGRENEDTYTWVLQHVNSWCREKTPTVIVTDRELGLGKAIPKVFPNAHHMLCIWHVERNIEQNAFNRSKRVEVQREFLTGCTILFKSKSRETFEERHRELTRRWGTSWGLMDYLNKTWVTHKEKLVPFWTDQHMHFGNKATSRVESAHAVYKKGLESTNYRLDTCLEQMHRMLRDEYRQLKASLEHSRLKIPNKVRSMPIFQPILKVVSHKCLNMLYEIFDKVCKADYSRDCDRCVTRSSLGLPCVHEVLAIVREGRAFHPTDVHIFWRQLRWNEVISDDGSAPNYVEVDRVAVEDLVQAVQAGTIDDHQISEIGRMWTMIQNPQCANVETPRLDSRKGRPSKKKGREPSGFEHTRESINKAREDRERRTAEQLRRHLEEEAEAAQSTTGGPGIVLMGYDFGNNTFERFMLQFITGVRNVRGDGNCGFRSLAVFLNKTEDEWLYVRQLLLNELVAHQDRYTLFAQDGEQISETIKRIYWTNMDGPAPPEHWMEMPICGALFATVFQCIIAFLDWGSAHTCLPLARQDPPPGSPRPGAIMYLFHDHRTRHFMPMSFQAGSPMPPIYQVWFAVRDVSMAGMEQQFEARVQLFRDLRQADGRPIA